VHIAIILGPFMPVPPVLGGAVEKVHVALALAYRAAGHQVTMISREYCGFALDETVDGIRHIRVRASERSPFLPVNLLRSLRYSLRATAALPPADVTITNEFFLPLILPRRRAGKIYVQVGRYPKYHMALYFRADRLQAVSNAVGDAIARQAPWLAERVKVIGYAIADAYFQPLPVEREKIVLYVGRIAREKGVELLIKAFLLLGPCLLEKWNLRIVGPHEISQGGDGAEYLAKLKQLARPIGERCQFAGPIFDETALVREYRAASIFVYPSLAEFGESFGVAPLEAMAGGCAALASDLRCFDDYLEDGVTGFRFDHRGATAASDLADRLARLMADPELLERVASAGNRTAGLFSTGPIAARMLGDFAALAGHR
jgi:glycosyltransferase involved in cell wall biosynthesis